MTTGNDYLDYTTTHAVELDALSTMIRQLEEHGWKHKDLCFALHPSMLAELSEYEGIPILRSDRMERFTMYGGTQSSIKRLMKELSHVS
jgi:hypothetical protein